MPVAYFLEHDDMLKELGRATGRAEFARTMAADTDDEAGREGWARNAEAEDRVIRHVEARLRDHRKAMRAAGLDPGRLLHITHHVEDDTDEDTSAH